MAIKRSQLVREIKDEILQLVENGITIFTDETFLTVDVSLNVSGREMRKIVTAVIDRHFGEEIVSEED